MSTFSLLEQLNTPTNDEVKTSPFPKGIQYQEYEIQPKDGSITVFIPLRECEAFEEEIQVNVLLLQADVRNITRKYRGIVE